MGCLFDLMEPADDVRLRSLLLPGRSVAVDDDLSVARVAVSSTVLLLTLVSSADWSALTSVACLAGGVRRSFLAAAGAWLDDEARDGDDAACLGELAAAEAARTCSVADPRRCCCCCCFVLSMTLDG